MLLALESGDVTPTSCRVPRRQGDESKIFIFYASLHRPRRLHRYREDVEMEEIPGSAEAGEELRRTSLRDFKPPTALQRVGRSYSRRRPSRVVRQPDIEHGNAGSW